MGHSTSVLHNNVHETLTKIRAPKGFLSTKLLSPMQINIRLQSLKRRWDKNEEKCISWLYSFCSYDIPVAICIFWKTKLFLAHHHSKLWSGLQHRYRARIFQLLRSSGIDSKESIPPAYVAWRAGVTTLSYSVPSPHRLFKNYSTVTYTSHSKNLYSPVCKVSSHGACFTQKYGGHVSGFLYIRVNHKWP